MPETNASSNAGSRSRLGAVYRSLPGLIAIIALMIALVTLYIASTDQSGVRPRVNLGNTVEVDEAQIILDRANDATNFVGNLLSFLEVSLGVISAVLVVGAWLLRGLILDQIDESQELGRDLRNQLKDYETRFETLQASVNDTLKGMEASFRVQSLQLLAEQQVRAHNFDTAIVTLKSALAIRENDHATNYLLGYLYTQRKEIDLAIAHLERALTRDPAFTPAIAALGLALRRKGDSMSDPALREERDHYWEQAEANLRQALGKDPKLTDADGESYFGTLGGLYRRQEHYYAALDAYERAHHVTPTKSYPIINLASIHTYLGNKADSEHYFTEVTKWAALQLDDDPRDAWTRCDMAQAKLVLGEKSSAFRHIRRVVDQTPEAGVLETVRSGLVFLLGAPHTIDGLQEMIDLIDEVLSGHIPAFDESLFSDDDSVSGPIEH